MNYCLDLIFIVLWVLVFIFFSSLMSVTQKDVTLDDLRRSLLNAFHIPQIRTHESGVARRELSAIKHARALRHRHTFAVGVQCLAVRTVTAFYAPLAARAASGFSDVTARPLARVTAHLVFLTSSTFQH